MNCWQERDNTDDAKEIEECPDCREGDRLK